MHWADTDELARLGEIAAVVANCQILFIMTTRPEGDPISASWRARARGCPVTTVDLAPLAEDEAQELAAHYPELSQETIEACIQRAEGYPLFLDQLLRAASAGHDRCRDPCGRSSWRAPTGCRPRITRRCRRLPCSDIARRWTSLRRMIDDDEYDPTPLIETALVRFDGVDMEFVHALFRDAIYESTLKSQRRELHRTAAEWYAHGDPALRADHLAAADDERATAAYLEASIAEQVGVALRASARRSSNKASALAREPIMLHKSSLLLGELLLQLGRTHDALTAYREALDFAIDQHGHGSAWIGIASALRIMDRHEEALEALEQRRERARRLRRPAQTRARIHTLRGNLCFPLGRLDACLQAHEQAHRLRARRRSRTLEIARALGGLGDAYYQRGSMVTAREHFAQCIKEARDHDLVGVLLANLPMLAITHTYCGDPAGESRKLAAKGSSSRGASATCAASCSCT